MESTNIDFSAINALLDFLINSPVVPPPIFVCVSIHRLLLLKAILIESSREFADIDGSLQVYESVVTEVGSIISSFDLSKMNQYTSHKLCEELERYILLEQNLPRKYQIYTEMRMPSPAYYPITSRFIFINHLLENLEELMKDSDSSTFPFNYAIMTVQRELRFWYSDLVEISSNPPLFLKEVIQTITKLAYDIEYVLDSFLVGDVPSWLCILWLFGIFEEFEKIEYSGYEEEDLSEKKAMINDFLLGGDEQLNMITILSPSGERNEAFAKELYNSPSVIDHFESRAGCHYKYSDKDTDIRPLLELLGDLVDLSDIIRSKNYDELTTLIFECLKGQRFLVVIDAIAWGDKILRCFPNSHNGSRIVLITPIKEFVFADKFKSMVQPQSPQNDKRWESLSCPSEMLEIRMRISRRCKPESRIWVANLLQTIHKVDQWEEVANTLGSRAFGQEGTQLKRILDLTCIFLPDHLRSCFIYLKVLSVYIGEKILVSELIRFWIAEGFVKQMPSQSLENTGEDYVADLMARNLLVSTKEKTLGRAKTCILDPVVHDFLTIKVNEDNFLQIEDSKDPDASSSSSSSPPILYKRRLYIWSTWDEFIMLKPSGRFVHSLFYSDYELYEYSRDISFIFNNFKFLRILKLENIVTGDSLLEVGVLVLLRYLSIQSSLTCIPPSISNLWDLETFLFHQSDWEVVQVPDCIWDMKKLRHFHIQTYTYFDLNPHRLENSSSVLKNLQTFSRPVLVYGDHMEKILRRLPGIQKLSCVFLDSWDDYTECNRFPVLEFLDRLISLKVEYDGSTIYPCVFNFPSNLKKLTLKCFKMPWNEISQIAMLSNLEVLKLLENAFKGERWEMEDHVLFPKLKYLKLECESVVEWSATRNHFPNLEHLVLVGCKELVEIPQDFAYISSIRMIEVKKCTPSAENSVRLIQEQHMKCWGHDELKISCTGDSTESG